MSKDYTNTKLLELIDEFAEKLKQHVLSAPTEPDGESLYEGIFDFDFDDLYDVTYSLMVTDGLSDTTLLFSVIIYCMVLAKRFE